MRKKENQLDTIFPQDRIVTIKDVEINIKPFKFGKLPQVFRTIEPIAEIFQQLVKEEAGQLKLYSALIARGGDNVIELIVVGSGQERSWVCDLDLDEGIELLSAIVEVNSSFFIQKILPRLEQTLPKVTGQMS